MTDHSFRKRVVAIAPTDLTCICVNHQARLWFGEVEVVIEGPFLLTVDDVVHRLDPDARIDLGPLLALYPAVLTAAQVSERAALHLHFDSGATIVVPPDPHYEAWQIHDGHGWLLVCAPGTAGQVTEWTPPTRQD